MLVAALVLAAVAVGSLVLRRRADQSRDVATESTAVPPGPAAGSVAPIVEAPYTVDAAFFRGTTIRNRLTAGGRLRVGDALSLELKSSRELYVYVINEDDEGEAVLLFPRQGGRPSNPLSAAVTHLLPGAREGIQDYWQVTSAGGREHFLVVASPERLAELESESADLTRPEPNRPLRYDRLSEGQKLHLRGVAGLIAGPAPKTGSSRTPLFEIAEELTTGPEVVRGAWIRRLDLENPAH